MTRLSRLLLFAAIVSAPIVVSGAQDATGDTACTYERCAVWLDRGTLRRGASGAVVLRDGFFRPMRLPAFVGGADSATIWAKRFERRAQAGTRLSAIGFLSLAVGIGTQYVRTRSIASGAIDDANGFEGALSLGGVIAIAGGLLLRTSAEPARNRAVWWYNRRFAPASSP